MKLPQGILRLIAPTSSHEFQSFWKPSPGRSPFILANGSRSVATPCEDSSFRRPTPVVQKAAPNKRRFLRTHFALGVGTFGVTPIDLEVVATPGSFEVLQDGLLAHHWNSARFPAALCQEVKCSFHVGHAMQDCILVTLRSSRYLTFAFFARSGPSLPNSCTVSFENNTFVMGLIEGFSTIIQASDPPLIGLAMSSFRLGRMALLLGDGTLKIFSFWNELEEMRSLKLGCQPPTSRGILNSNATPHRSEEVFTCICWGPSRDSVIVGGRRLWEVDFVRGCMVVRFPTSLYREHYEHANAEYPDDFGWTALVTCPDNPRFLGALSSFTWDLYIFDLGRRPMMPLALLPALDTYGTETFSFDLLWLPPTLLRGKRQLSPRCEDPDAEEPVDYILACPSHRGPLPSMLLENVICWALPSIGAQKFLARWDVRESRNCFSFCVLEASREEAAVHPIHGVLRGPGDWMRTMALSNKLARASSVHIIKVDASSEVEYHPQAPAHKGCIQPQVVLAAIAKDLNLSCLPASPAACDLGFLSSNHLVRHPDTTCGPQSLHSLSMPRPVCGCNLSGLGGWVFKPPSERSLDLLCSPDIPPLSYDLVRDLANGFKVADLLSYPWISEDRREVPNVAARIMPGPPCVGKEGICACFDDGSSSDDEGTFDLPEDFDDPPEDRCQAKGLKISADLLRFLLRKWPEARDVPNSLTNGPAKLETELVQHYILRWADPISARLAVVETSTRREQQLRNLMSAGSTRRTEVLDQLADD